MKTNLKEVKTKGKEAAPALKDVRFPFGYDCEEVLSLLDQANLKLNKKRAMFQFSYDREIVSQDQVRNEGVSIAGRDVYYQRYEPSVATMVLSHRDGVNCEKEHPTSIKGIEKTVTRICSGLSMMGYDISNEQTEDVYHISGRHVREKGGVMTSVQDVNVSLIPKRDGVVSARIHIERATYYDNSHIEGHGVSKENNYVPLNEINKVAELVNGAFSLTEHCYKPVGVTSK